MAEFLVDKLLNAMADAVLKKLQDEFKLVTGVKNEVQNLSFTLQMIKRLLQDAQRRKLKEEAVGIWLDKLDDVAYDMDDALDEWNTQVQKLKLKADKDSNSRSAEVKKTVAENLRNKVCSFLLSICSCFKEVSVRHDFAQKIKDLNGRMDMLFQEANNFKFVQSDLNSNYEKLERISTTSFFDESKLCGRESDKDTIVSELISSDRSAASDGIPVVSIVGPGGIGKTTLAQVVCNNNRVKDHFELTKWVCVSDPFDQIRIAKAILEDPERSALDASELETLVQRVKALVSGKKFLLVLDDVWTEDDSKWEPIRDSLKHGARGSRILVTTRKEGVARMMETNYMHHLSQLLEEDCWNILSRVAFSGRSDEKESKRLKEIGFEISKKCKGLPLAAKFLGSLLRFKYRVEQWEDVLKSEIWELKEAGISLFPQIYLSYNELSPEMKRCFSYCAVFPKDYDIIVEDLIRQWMAQGYLSSGGRVREPESWGYECFENLAMRSFFQDLDRGEIDMGRIIFCKMHDIVHDFAQYLTKGECLIIADKESMKKAKNLLSCTGKVRHLRWLPDQEDVAVSSVVADVGKLRSFHYLGMNGNSLRNLFHSLKRIRALSLRGADLKEVPRAIGNLIHLRYLDLSFNSFDVLPDEICNLYNLETLEINFCSDLTQLPHGIGKLINLRHLSNFRTPNLNKLPQALEKSTSLRTLGSVKVGDGYDKFEYLKNLNQLNEIFIEFFEINELDFDAATLRDKVNIRELRLEFRSKETNYTSLLKPLQAPPNLEYLCLYEYPDSKLPSWITSLSNLKTLEILSSPLLEGRYRKDGGEDWIYISHIPNVVIDGKKQ